MTADDLITALELPAASRVERRVPKTEMDPIGWTGIGTW
jgi:hypothetical protein